MRLNQISFQPSINTIRTPKKTRMTKTSVTTVKNLKTFGLILSLGALAWGGGLAGCAGTRTTQSTGERIDDHGASSRVKSALSADTQYKYDLVKIETFKGTVQLSGFVNSRDQKNRAAELTKNVEGVKEVVNNITVKESTN
jgi:hyperosmotically inducible protein